MSSELLHAFRHSGWANRRLLDFCDGLTEAQLAASLPSGHGTPLGTMKHVIGAESFYYALLAGSALAWDWQEERRESAAELLVFADDLAQAWDRLLAVPYDVEKTLTRQRASGEVMRLNAGVMLAQALHHANIHREQVCAVITSLGLTPPDVSLWAYGDATGTIER